MWTNGPAGPPEFILSSAYVYMDEKRKSAGPAGPRNPIFFRQNARRTCVCAFFIVILHAHFMNEPSMRII